MELFLPETGQICTLDWMWGDRLHGYTLNVIPSTREIVFCGEKKCQKWTPSGWTGLANLKKERLYHTALAVEDDLLLIGGETTWSTEVVGGDMSYEIEPRR